MLHESGSEDPALYELYSHSNRCLISSQFQNLESMEKGFGGVEWGSSFSAK